VPSPSLETTFWAILLKDTHSKHRQVAKRHVQRAPELRLADLSLSFDFLTAKVARVVFDVRLMQRTWFGNLFQRRVLATVLRYLPELETMSYESMGIRQLIICAFELLLTMPNVSSLGCSPGIVPCCAFSDDECQYDARLQTLYCPLSHAFAPMIGCKL
jgi:hypothetical protein